MLERPIYLDHNATTPVLPEVVDAMLPFLREHFGNPSSAHGYGRVAREAVERARNEVAALLGCAANEIVFTSGGTEANNLAIRGSRNGGRRGIVTSVIEHPAVAESVAALEHEGFVITRLGVDSNGRVRESDLASAINTSTALVTLMHSNNETGALQPVRQAAEAAHGVGALAHTDAAQSIGKVSVNVSELGVDLLSIAGHKVYAPKGVGALYVRRGTDLVPIMFGGGHERGIRPSTENVASIVGLGTACAIARRDLERESARVRGLRDRFWAILAAEIPKLAQNGHSTERLPNTLNVRFPGVSGTALLSRTTGIAASTGAACHEGKEASSLTLLAMGIGNTEALGSIRLSLGRDTSLEDVEHAAGQLADCWRQLVES